MSQAIIAEIERVTEGLSVESLAQLPEDHELRSLLTQLPSVINECTAREQATTSFSSHAYFLINLKKVVGRNDWPVSDAAKDLLPNSGLVITTQPSNALRKRKTDSAAPVSRKKSKTSKIQ